MKGPKHCNLESVYAKKVTFFLTQTRYTRLRVPVGPTLASAKRKKKGKRRIPSHPPPLSSLVAAPIATEREREPPGRGRDRPSREPIHGCLSARSSRVGFHRQRRSSGRHCCSWSRAAQEAERRPPPRPAPRRKQAHVPPGPWRCGRGRRWSLLRRKATGTNSVA